MLNLSPDILICRIITLVIALTVHEFCHALAADRLGDMTPRAAGRLTLNPLVHLDLFGSMLMLITGYGWAKPTPVNPAAVNRNSKYGMLWVSLAGPFSNLGLAVLAGLPFRFGLVQYTAPSGWLPSLGEFLYQFFLLNVVLAIFNLIPLPPLDGEKVLSALLPPNAAATYDKIRPYGPFILMALLFLGPLVHLDVISWIMTPILTGLQKLIIGV